MFSPEPMGDRAGTAFLIIQIGQQCLSEMTCLTRQVAFLTAPQNYKREAAHGPAVLASSLSEFDLWSQGYDASWIDRAVALVIMTLDMHEVHCFGDARHLIKTAQVARQFRIVRNSAQVDSGRRFPLGIA